jgi:hypothetical protein
MASSSSSAPTNIDNHDDPDAASNSDPSLEIDVRPRPGPYLTLYHTLIHTCRARRATLHMGKASLRMLKLCSNLLLLITDPLKLHHVGNVNGV